MTPRSSSTPVALVGLPGAGKSTVAPLLAAILGRTASDLDDLLALAFGLDAGSLLRESGEAAFREREREILRRALETHASATERSAGGLVLSCGGGVIADSDSRRLLSERATVVWLTVEPATALARLGAAGVAARPLLAGPEHPDPLERLRALGAARTPHYEAIAHVRVGTDGRTAVVVAEAVAEALHERWRRSAS